MSIKNIAIAGTLGLGLVGGGQLCEDHVQDQAIAEAHSEEKRIEDGLRDQRIESQCMEYVRDNVRRVGSLEEQVEIDMATQRACKEVMKTVGDLPFAE
jgi:hypothetical protein